MCIKMMYYQYYIIQWKKENLTNIIQGVKYLI